jgi:hypothetical protein
VSGEALAVLILFYGSPVGGAEPGAGVALPPDVEITLDRRRLPEADAVVFHVPTLPRWRWWQRPRKRRGQVWVAWSMESQANYPRLGEPHFLRRFDLTMTYRLDSDVPVPYVDYYSSAENFARALREPPRPKTEPAPAVSFVSSGIDLSGRRGYLAELARHLPVDSYGAFMRNRRLEPDGGRPTKLGTIARYRFTLAFENSIDRDYVTEKFFDPLVVGSVPVYLGAPNAEDFAPGDRCFIDVTRFAGPRQLADYLLALHHDPAEYAALLAWKECPFRPTFTHFLAGQAVNPLLRLVDRIRRAA